MLLASAGFFFSLMQICFIYFLSFQVCCCSRFLVREVRPPLSCDDMTSLSFGGSSGLGRASVWLSGCGTWLWEQDFQAELWLASPQPCGRSSKTEGSILCPLHWQAGLLSTTPCRGLQRQRASQPHTCYHQTVSNEHLKASPPGILWH